MTETANFQQLVRRRLAGGAPCSLNPDEIAAIQALFEDRDALQRLADRRAEQRDALLEDRDTWRRVAERLEREKIALAQDVLNGRDRLIAQAEALEEAANDCVPAMHQMAHWLRARADECRRKAEGADDVASKACPECETDRFLKLEKEPSGSLQMVCSRCGMRARSGETKGIATLHWNGKAGGE